MDGATERLLIYLRDELNHVQRRATELQIQIGEILQANKLQGFRFTMTGVPADQPVPDELAKEKTNHDG